MRLVKKIILPLALLLQLSFAQTYYSPICAAYNFSASQGDAFLTVPAARQIVFSGIVKSAEGGEIFADLSGASADCFAKKHYVKFVSGGLKGAWFKICANSLLSLELDISETDAAKISAGDEFKIIPFWTLDTLLPEGAGLKKSEGEISGTECAYVFKFSYFDFGGEMRIPEGINRAPSSVFYFRKDAGGGRWVLKGDPSLADCGGEILEPDCFLIVRTPENFEMVLCGEVFKLPKSLVFKNLGEAAQDNFYAAPTLTALPITALNPLIENSIMAENSLQNPEAGDFVMAFAKSNSAENPKPEKIYFYSGTWYRTDAEFKNPAPAGGDVLEAGEALVFRLSALSPHSQKRAEIVPEYAK
ncbi:MAG: TIGR02597 family protein [Opitutales bacterium]|nr:TIGR02597 family protein [Opitutales bacterium]